MVALEVTRPLRRLNKAWSDDKVLILNERPAARAAGWPVAFNGELIPDVRGLPAGISSSRHSRGDLVRSRVGYFHQLNARAGSCIARIVLVGRIVPVLVDAQTGQPGCVAVMVGVVESA